MIGSTISHYRIVEKIGEGGMGVVYRARDERLDRDVAIKVLPEAVAQDAERLARFEREARSLASLSHQNIATLHGLEEHEGMRFLVMELAEGETLARRLGRGPMAVQDALEIAREIAEGLEAAHERGIVHRDLKPANVMLSPAGRVKILDFGLAKTWQPEQIDADSTDSPTLTARMTAAGVLLGTAAYMSPEQARGRAVDKRADIWAFGCCLYEMLSGARAFQGETVTDVLAAVVRSEPDWRLLPADTPRRIRDLATRCLRKEVRGRLHDIADARIEIEEELAGVSDAAEFEVAALSSWRRLLPWGLVGLLAAAVVLVSLVRWPTTDTGSRVSSRLSINLPPDTPLAPAAAMPLSLGRPTLALSPDGGWLAVVVLTNGETHLHLREMASGEMHPVPGTKGAHSPFFSPDGNWVGFFADDKLKKVSVSRSEPLTLCAATLAFGGSWGEKDIIYFSADEGARLYQVSAAGGARKSIDSVTSPKFPHILPGGRALLLTDRDSVVIQDLYTGESKILQKRGTFARYSPTGHIVFAWRGRLFAAAFDLDRLVLTGPPIAVLDGVRWEGKGAAQFTFANDRTLVFSPGGDTSIGRLVWIDQEGAMESLGAPPGDYEAFHIAPDGKRVAAPISGETDQDIWIYDIERGSHTRFTFDGTSTLPIWTPDGNAIFYSSMRDGTWVVCRKAVDGRDEPEQVSAKGSPVPRSISPDGKFLLLETYDDQGTGSDIWLLPLEDDSSLAAEEERESVFLRTPFEEFFPAVSPDGRWLAYTSDETGGWEVYVRSFPDAGNKVRVSTGGGEEPVWSPNGRDLYYRFGSQWYAAGVTLGDEFTAGRPRMLFEGPYINIPGRSYDVSPLDGRLLVVENAEQTKTVSELMVVTNWFDELKRRTEAGQ